MKLKNVTLAAALLTVLTGCGSSGGSSNPTPNAEVNNNQATQAQLAQQQAEVNKLKQALTQAQETQKEAQDKLQAAQNSSKEDVAKAQKNLADAQEKLANLQKNLEQAEKNLTNSTANQAELQKQLNQAKQDFENAKLVHANAEKALQQQLVNKDSDIAKAQDNLTASNDKLAKAEQDLKAAQAIMQAGNENKAALQNQLNEAKQNLEVAKQAKDEAEKALKTQVEKKDQLLNNAQNEKVQAQKALQAALDAKQKAEKALEDKNALDDKNNLDDIKRKNFINLAEERFSNGFNYTELIDENLSFPIEKFKKFLSFVDMVKATSDSKYGVDRGIIKFAKNFIDLDEVAFKNKLNKRLEFKNLVEKYPNAYGEYVSHDEFLTENFEKTLDEKLLILSSNLKGRGKYYYKEIDGFYPQGELIQTKMVKNSSSYEVSERNNKIYNQKYSVVISDYEKTTKNGFSPDVRESFITWNRGLPTLESALPIEGKATYSGKAFNHESNGNFTYTVNFKDKKGSGHITDIPNYGNINLEEASIQVKQPSKQPGIVGDASFNRNEQEVTGKYELNFYGPNAEEVAGNVIFNSYNGKDLGVGRGMYSNSFSNNETEIGFGGTRGEIQK